MKKILLLLFFILSSSYFDLTQAQLKQGEFIYDNSVNEGTGSMVLTTDGGYIIAGQTNGWVYVIKLDATATLQWSKKIGGSGVNVGYSIVQCKDGDYVISGSTSAYGAGNDDVYIIKLDQNGNILWTKTIGGPNYDYGYSIIQSNDGGFVIGGSTGVGSYDVYVVKLDSMGSLQWTKTIGGSGDDQGYSIIQNKNGDFVIAGRTNSYGAGNYDVYVVKVSSAGNLLWTKTIGGSGDDEGYSIIQAKDGGYAVTGYSASYGAGNNDMYVIKLDSIGTLSWTKTIGGANDDRGNSIIQNKSGGFTIAGSTNSFGPGIGSNVYLVSLDSLGNLLWTKAIGGTYDDVGNSIVQCSDRGYAISGGTNSFGAGGHYIYFLKTDSLGNLCADTGSGGTISSGGSIGTGGVVGSLGTLSSGGIDSTITSVQSTLCAILNTPNISDNFTTISLYPNPCTTTLNIDIENPSVIRNSKFVIDISDITGRVLLTYDLSLTTYHFPIDVSALVPGMYFLRINSGSGTEVKKFIKQ